ncbi:hypothetical protein ZIOFF_056226 [Zingiber officinale]|uniref:Uncharacterized protein n=1 Tax=Zingiber officinale TaxID=94328 RepID=A0A8J5FHV1_ZINOF|nr:hypothetical protein ZIOFF_056226 [Zingiber officinale]
MSSWQPKQRTTTATATNLGYLTVSRQSPPTATSPHPLCRACNTGCCQPSPHDSFHVLDSRSPSTAVSHRRRAKTTSESKPSLLTSPLSKLRSPARIVAMLVAASPPSSAERKLLRTNIAAGSKSVFDAFKLDCFDGMNFTRWKDKLFFLLAELGVAYLLLHNLPTIPTPTNKDTDEIKAT